MGESILIIGGCRSGKSSLALRLAEQTGKKRIFLATCIAFDDEMKDRIARHQQERAPGWQTVEAAYGVDAAIRHHGVGADVILLDCLTLWINNLLMKDMTEEAILSKCRDLVSAVQEAPCPVILVSNEVGGGIVPENELARLYRDLMGTVNQRVAAGVDHVVWTVAGLAVAMKADPAGALYQWLPKSMGQR